MNVRCVCSVCDVDLCWLCGHGCCCDHRNQDRSEDWCGGIRVLSPSWNLQGQTSWR
jgi:hypothetical protein